MYLSHETFYRAPDGSLTTTPGEGHELVAVCGAVMSDAEARQRGLLPPVEPPAGPADPPAKPEATPNDAPEPEQA